jgi:hypothetical protein
VSQSPRIVTLANDEPGVLELPEAPTRSYNGASDFLWFAVSSSSEMCSPTEGELLARGRLTPPTIDLRFLRAICLDRDELGISP